MVMLTRLSVYLVWTLLLMALMCSTSFAATIKATIDRTTVQENESISLTFSSDSDVDDDPNFSKLEKDFRILNRSQSSNISIINGRVNRQITWQLMLMPKRAGKLSIPAISFGRDRSNALSVKVLPVTASSSGGGAGGVGDELVYIDAEVDSQSVYIQSQLIYTLRIYHAVQLRNASLSDLEISDSDAVVERLAENRSYEKILNGRRYRVIEKQYAIFPQTVGKLKIEPAVLEAQYIDLPRVLRTKRVVSDPVSIDVKPIPSQARQMQNNYWLPARSLTLTEQWSDSKKEIKVGEPVTRTLTINASGLLSSQLPELGKIVGTGTVKQYSDQPVLENEISDLGISGKREEKIAYIPSQPGQLKLPAIEITWWNTEGNTLQSAKLPERIIKVTGVAAQKSLPSAPIDNEQFSRTETQDLSDNQKREPAIESIAGASSQVWFGISVALAVLWMLTITGWYVSARKKRQHHALDQTAKNSHVSTKEALKSIKIACDNNDPHQVKSALISWAQEQWSEHPPTSVGHVAQCVNGELAKELEQLNNVLYKPGGSQWDGKTLWLALQDFCSNQETSDTNNRSTLVPLYRLAKINEE